MKMKKIGILMMMVFLMGGGLVFGEVEMVRAADCTSTFSGVAHCGQLFGAGPTAMYGEYRTETADWWCEGGCLLDPPGDCNSADPDRVFCENKKMYELNCNTCSGLAGLGPCDCTSVDETDCTAQVVCQNDYDYNKQCISFATTSSLQASCVESRSASCGIDISTKACNDNAGGCCNAAGKVCVPDTDGDGVEECVPPASLNLTITSNDNPVGTLATTTVTFTVKDHLNNAVNAMITIDSISCGSLNPTDPFIPITGAAGKTSSTFTAPGAAGTCTIDATATKVGDTITATATYLISILDTTCITHGLIWNNDPYTDGDTVKAFGQSLGTDASGACIELYDNSNNKVDSQQIPWAALGNMNSVDASSAGKAGTWTAKLYINNLGCVGVPDCTIQTVVGGGGGGGGCTIIWSDWGDCTGNLGTQTRTDTNCGTGGTKSRYCCDTDSGNTIPDNHCVLTTPICDTSVPPGVCVECLTTPDCNWKGPDYVCENKVCIPCKGEGETATAAHLCCYGLNWLNGICTSACDPNAWFFCNPLRGNVETLVEGGERIIGYILGLIGSVALLLIIISGAMYMTSAGSEERIASSKKILTAAVIGLAIALLAYSLLLVIMTVLGM